MPFEAFCALPEKSPPIVCEEKRTEVRCGTGKSGSLILAPRKYKLPLISAPMSARQLEHSAIQDKVSFLLPYQFRKDQDYAKQQLKACEALQCRIKTVVPPRGNAWPWQCNQRASGQRKQSHFLGHWLSNTFTATCKSSRVIIKTHQTSGVDNTFNSFD